MAVTGTGTDIVAAIQKRTLASGLRLRGEEALTLMLDIMTVINTDAANVLADAVTELAANPVRPFLPSV